MSEIKSAIRHFKYYYFYWYYYRLVQIGSSV